MINRTDWSLLLANISWNYSIWISFESIYSINKLRKNEISNNYQLEIIKYYIYHDFHVQISIASFSCLIGKEREPHKQVILETWRIDKYTDIRTDICKEIDTDIATDIRIYIKTDQ